MATDPFFALYPRQPTAIPAIVSLIDAYVSEEHTLTLATTAHPIESGSSLTDNAVKQPEQLKLSGWVSDLLPVPGAEVGPLGDRAPDAWAALVKLFEERVPVQVITHLRTYPQMLILKATAPVDVNTGQSLRFTLELQEVLFAQTRIVRFPPDVVNPRGPAADRTSAVDGGDRPAAFVSPEQTAAFLTELT